MKLCSSGICLRSICSSDVPVLYDKYTSSDLAHFIPAFSIPRSAEWIGKRHVVETEDVQATYRFAIGPPDNRAEILGVASLMNVDFIHRRGSIGIQIFEPSNRHRGVGATSLSILSDWAFGTLGLHRIEGNCLVSNTAMIKLFERVGFACECKLRDYFYLNGRFVDAFQYVKVRA